MVKHGSLSHADGHPPMGVNTVNIAITWNPYGGMTISHAAIFQENSNRPTEHTCCHLQIGHERIPFIRQVRGTWGEVCSLCSHHFRCISCIIAVIRQDFWKSRRWACQADPPSEAKPSEVRHFRYLYGWFHGLEASNFEWYYMMHSFSLVTLEMNCLETHPVIQITLSADFGVGDSDSAWCHVVCQDPGRADTPVVYAGGRESSREFHLWVSRNWSISIFGCLMYLMCTDQEIGFQFERCTRTDVVLTYRAYPSILFVVVDSQSQRAKMKNTALYFMLLEVLRASAGDAIAQVHPWQAHPSQGQGPQASASSLSWSFFL